MAASRRPSGPGPERTSSSNREDAVRPHLAGLVAAADRLADPPVHLGDVAAVYVDDLGVLAQVLADLGEHPLLVSDTGLVLGLLWKMVFDVAINQVLNRGRRATLALAAGRVVASVDQLAKFLGSFAGRVGGPARERPDGYPPLAAIDPVIDEKGLAAAGVAADAEARGLGITVPPHFAGG